MPTDSYRDYMYNAALRKKHLLREIKNRAGQINGIDVLLKHADLTDRQTGILLRQRDKIYGEREALIEELYKL